VETLIVSAGVLKQHNHTQSFILCHSLWMMKAIARLPQHSSGCCGIQVKPEVKAKDADKSL